MAAERTFKKVTFSRGVEYKHEKLTHDTTFGDVINLFKAHFQIGSEDELHLKIIHRYKKGAIWVTDPEETLQGDYLAKRIGLCYDKIIIYKGETPEPFGCIEFS